MFANHSHNQHDHNGEPTRALTDPEHYHEAQRSTWVSVWVNLLLSILQVIVGFLAHSQALVADGIHSISDLLCDFLVLFANRRGAEPPDSEHPYGHGRIETASSLALGLALVLTGGSLLWFAALRMQHVGDLPNVLPMALWMAIATLVGKELLFRYMLSVGERLRSPMLVANAWHARADAASSLVVILGIGGALLGYVFADSLAAALVGYMIVRIGLKFTWRALRDLIDTGLSAEETEAIRQNLQATPGVHDVHELRTRRMGRHVLVDTHLEVDSRISVSEGHYIAEAARANVLGGHRDVLDVLVHIDPENDVQASPQSGLLERETLLNELETFLPPDLPPPNRVVLHYLQGTVEAEVFYTAPDNLDDKSSQSLLAQLSSAREQVAKHVERHLHWQAVSLKVE